MAGESPDKSEQRRSSGETTRQERDPRLAVLRQTAQEPGPVHDTPSASSSMTDDATEDSSPAAGATPTGNDARLRAAVAAWAATADDDTPPGGAEADAPAETDTDAAEAAGPARGGAGGPADASADASAQNDAVDDAADDAAPATRAAGEPDEAAKAAEADAEQSSATPAKDGDGPSSRFAPAGAAKGAENAAPTPVRHPATDAADGAGSSDRTAQKASTDAGTPAAALAPAPFSSSGADAKSEGGVDQPTTVFKALRRPPVDQPTTALKMPSLPKTASQPEPKPAPDPEPRREPEADAERTSTFVPLRRDDVHPSPARPAAPTGSAGPAATARPLPGAAEAPASLAEAERTRQQPMPPLPPLDLLAELTNTPPPPETPVRTAVRRVKIWTPLVLLLLIVFALVQLVRPLPDPTLDLTARETYTFEGGKLELPWPSEGQGAAEVVGVGSLGTYGAQKPAPIASVAKTMTAYVILRDHPLKGEQVGPKITVDKQAEEESKATSESTAPIKEGQRFTEKQMLQLLMIPSGNNAARLLARWDAGSEEAFVKKMNDAAKDLGMTNTTYTDPSGLKSSTVSTPLDQIKLGKAVMENDVFREIVNMTLVEIPGIDGKIRNNNDRALLMEGVGGIKTGSSTPAGGNLLWSANALVDGEIRRIIGIVMGAQDAAQLWQKLEKAIDYSIALIPPAQQAVTSATVVKKGDVVGHVDDGLGGRTPVVATKDLKAVGWSGLDVKIEIAPNGNAVPHSAKAGTVVGQVSVGEGVGKVSAPVALQRDLAEPGIGAKITRLG